MFPREIHHILNLERPECWVTCDSIGLFLETECQFPSEESEDDCYEDYGFKQRQGYSLTKMFVKKASVELIDLYRRFVSPSNPLLFLLLFLEHPPWIAESFYLKAALRMPYIEQRPEDLVISSFARLFMCGLYSPSFRHP